MAKKTRPKDAPNAGKSTIFTTAYDNCHVDTNADPVACSSDFPLKYNDLKAAAPKNIDPVIWGQAEATGGCRKKVQDDAKKTSPCECRYDRDNEMMHCHCYDPDSLNPPRPHRPDM